NIQEHLPHLADLEVIFSTWGMFKLTPEQLDMLPNLKFIFYGAGSVAGFAHCFLERGIRVMSAWGANAIPVAEFTVAQIVLAMKGYFTNLQHTKSLAGYVSWNRTIHHGNFAQTVAILGCGMIGKEVIRRLKDYNLNILVYDPYVSEKQAKQMGCTKVELLEAFQKADVVSNHMPNIPATVGNIDKACFEALRDGGVFINTGRGRTVKEDEMIEVLKRRPSLTALLDVTWPEPPAENSPLFTMDNVFLSSHIAGSIGNEVIRMADYCLAECERYVNGEPLQYEITAEMLKTMA
ncbi:MAG: hydroxyacid dehydrogenase, partial [Clostridia bacterium]|nr:hydroxyacid dehydrogenase [Clostridia bacterium]